MGIGRSKKLFMSNKVGLIHEVASNGGALYADTGEEGWVGRHFFTSRLFCSYYHMTPGSDNPADCRE